MEYRHVLQGMSYHLRHAPHVLQLVLLGDMIAPDMVST
jgi:hypothetical protein